MAWRIVRGFVIIATVVALAATAYWAFAKLGPGPEGHLTMATGGSVGIYHDLATTWQKGLARYGVKLDLKKSAEGFVTLRALLDKSSGVDAGFVKGGLVGSLQGRLASNRAKEWHERELDKLRSVGRILYEPIWVFTRGDLPIESLRDLHDRRILVGVRQSGARRVASQLLRANGVGRDNATLIEEDLPADAAPLLNGEADAAIIILPADSDVIQKLLRVPSIRLMDFSPEADAYTTRFPALSKIVLTRGSVEFQPLIPSAHITLLTTTAALVVRADLHPALISLLTYTIIQNPRPAFDKAGDPILFYKAGEFPSANDPEFEVSADARSVYRSGELPFLLRVLAPLSARAHLPFSVAAFANAHGAQAVLLLIPMLTVLIPLIRIAPAIYTWTVRRRLLYWYRQLKALERRLDRAGSADDMLAHRAEIDRIDAGVRRIRVPLAFSDRFYDLRGHIELVRLRVEPRATPLRVAAE